MFAKAITPMRSVRVAGLPMRLVESAFNRVSPATLRPIADLEVRCTQLSGWYEGKQAHFLVGATLS